MNNNSVVKHKENYGNLRLEGDFVTICSRGKSPSHCKALILTVLENHMNAQRAKGGREYMCLTVSEWITHTYMFYSRDSIMDSLEELAEEKLIIRQPITRNNKKTSEYTLHLENIDLQLRMLPDNTCIHEPEEIASTAKDQRIYSQLPRIRRHNKRAILAGLPATLSSEQWLQTLEDFDYSCAFCKGSYDVLEHFVPLANKSEGTTECNCIPACSECNRIKSDTHPLMLPADSPLSLAVPSIMRYLEMRGKNE